MATFSVDNALSAHILLLSRSATVLRKVAGGRINISWNTLHFVSTLPIPALHATHSTLHAAHIPMPAITSGKVLVTGANGYIAVWVVKAFLDQGFSVRGTVRSESKATHLRSLFKPFGDKFEVVIIEDITKVREQVSLS